MKHMLRPMVLISFFVHPPNFFFLFYQLFFSFLFLIFCLFYGLLGGRTDIYSGLTFVGVNCQDAVFLNGIAPQQIWFQVTKND